MKAADESNEDAERRLAELIAVAEKACVNYVKGMADNDPHRGPLNYLIDAIAKEQSHD
jgi:hypothetical protein